jgi:uncharacterized low-complexity protein
MALGRLAAWQSIALLAALAAGAVPLGLAQRTRAHEDPTAAVRQVVRSYEVALMTGDGERACAQLTDGARDELLRGAGRAGLGGDCRSVGLAAKGYMDSLIARAPSPAKAAAARRLVQNPPIEMLAVGDDSATARIVGTIAEPVRLVREDGGWRISELSLPRRGA